MARCGSRYYRDAESLNYNLSFAGCGFLGIYHAGVISCIRRFAPHLYVNRPISGASAGGIAAAFLICDVKTEDCVRYFAELINKSRQYTLGAFDPRFKITEYLREGLERLLPADAHTLCSGRLYISMTRQSSRENVVISQFKDRAELIQVILCSSFIPLFGGFVPPMFHGDYFIDGALSDNLPSLDKNTITVSPFCGDADICPRDDMWDSKELATVAGHIFLSQTSIILNWMNAKRIVNIVRPLSPKMQAELAVSGYDDALRFLLTRGFVACPMHRMPRAFGGRLRQSHSSSRLSAVRRTRKRRDMSIDLYENDSDRIKLNPDEEDAPLGSHVLAKENSNTTLTKSASRDLLCQLTDPLQTVFYKTTFGSRTLAVPQCLSCRSAMLSSYVSSLPSTIYNILAGSTDKEDASSSNNVQPQHPAFFSRLLDMVKSCVLDSVSPYPVSYVLAYFLRLLMSSAVFQVSVVQSITSACLSLLRNLPEPSLRVLQPLVDRLDNLSKILVSIVERGNGRTSDFASLLRSNQSLAISFSCLYSMIMSDFSQLLALEGSNPTASQCTESSPPSNVAPSRIPPLVTSVIMDACPAVLSPSTPIKQGPDGFFSSSPMPVETEKKALLFHLAAE
uniref:Patatin-like phospholipase domain-containing protein 2 n=1 Tax=Schistocephalus solidus TaxID=70667 RepID=A0A0X3NYS3_SCHSO